jgi:hypothetical protein
MSSESYGHRTEPLHQDSGIDLPGDEDRKRVVVSFSSAGSSALLPANRRDWADLAPPGKCGNRVCCAPRFRSGKKLANIRMRAGLRAQLKQLAIRKANGRLQVGGRQLFHVKLCFQTS